MQGAFASDDVGCTSSEECGLRQPHGPVTTLGRRGRTACNAKGRDRAPCRVRAGTLASRVTEGQTRTVTELGSRRPEPEYPIQEVRIWGPGPSVPGAEPAPEVRDNSPQEAPGTQHRGQQPLLTSLPRTQSRRSARPCSLNGQCSCFMSTQVRQAQPAVLRSWRARRSRTSRTLTLSPHLASGMGHPGRGFCASQAAALPPHPEAPRP
nr:fibronectin type III domain-containing protein 10 isoform X2 [Desmodus rotundus]